MFAIPALTNSSATGLWSFMPKIAPAAAHQTNSFWVRCPNHPDAEGNMLVTSGLLGLTGHCQSCGVRLPVTVNVPLDVRAVNH